MHEQAQGVEKYTPEIEHSQEITKRYARLQVLRDTLNNQIELEDISDEEKDILAQKTSVKLLRLFELLDTYSELESRAQPQQLARFDELFDSLCESEETRLPKIDSLQETRDSFLNDVLPLSHEASADRVVELPDDTPDEDDIRKPISNAAIEIDRLNRKAPQSPEMKVYDDFVRVLKQHPQADMLLANNRVRHGLIWFGDEMSKLSARRAKDVKANKELIDKIINVLLKRIKKNCNIDLG